jgi:type IV secretory pathway ATPase VirB11/archaellum biosynthesis ATPase
MSRGDHLKVPQIDRTETTLMNELYQWAHRKGKRVSISKKHREITFSQGHKIQANHVPAPARLLREKHGYRIYTQLELKL